ncbi:hypothetical protein diail_7797 [Diaporthe ilicicola]|nr:hypothetical protein diail_7797 [Diaporthe ilicicola]
MVNIILIPGSFAPPAIFSPLERKLAACGIHPVVIDLPSIGRRIGKPPATMQDDADKITRVTSEFLDAGQETILMAHSYGGIPATQSLENLSHAARHRMSKTGGVKTVVYLSAVVAPVGKSNWDLFGDNLPPFVHVQVGSSSIRPAWLIKALAEHTKDDYMSIEPIANAPLTFSDLPKNEALDWAKLMLEHSTASFKENLGYAGYNDVEVHYIVCEDDMIVPAEFQHAMVETAESSSGCSAVIHSIKSGHVPILSQPDSVVEILKQVVGMTK